MDRNIFWWSVSRKKTLPSLILLCGSDVLLRPFPRKSENSLYILRCVKANVVLWKQHQMDSATEDWDSLEVCQFKNFLDVQRRFTVLSVMSVDLERACKVHKVINAKVTSGPHWGVAQRL